MSRELETNRFEPWMPRHMVFQWYSANPYKGTPFRKFRPEEDMGKQIAVDCARHVNAVISRVMWRTRTGRV